MKCSSMHDGSRMPFTTFRFWKKSRELFDIFLRHKANAYCPLPTVRIARFWVSEAAKRSNMKIEHRPCLGRLASVVMSGAFLVLVQTTACNAQPAGAVSVKVVTENLNLRWKPDGGASVVTTLPFGTAMIVIGYEEPWVQVAGVVGGRYQSGWVHQDYVEVLKAAEPVQPLPPVRSRSVTENPLRISRSTLDCDEDYSDGGFDHCAVDVDFSINIPSPYTEYLARSVDVECDVEIEVTDAAGWRSTEDDDDRTTVYLGRGRASDDVTVEFDFGYRSAPIVEVKISDVECSVR